MKHVKMLGLLVMAAASLMAFASSASATAILTSPGGVTYGGEIHAELESGTEAVLKAGIEDKCKKSTVKGNVETNNTEHAAGAITALTFEECTQDTKVITAGSLTISDSGTVFSEGSRVEVKVTSLGITCFYGAETGKVDIGNLTGGAMATMDISTTTLQREKGSNEFFCSKEGTWTGSYTVIKPEPLFIT